MESYQMPLPNRTGVKKKRRGNYIPKGKQVTRLQVTGGVVKALACTPAKEARSVSAMAKVEPETVDVAKVGHNDPCPCGSGRKRKRCCA